MTNIRTLSIAFYIQTDYTIPILLVLVAMSKYSVAYTLLRSIYNFEQDGKLFAAIIQILSGIGISFCALVAFSQFIICFSITGFGLMVLYLGTLFIIPAEEEV